MQFLADALPPPWRADQQVDQGEGAAGGSVVTSSASRVVSPRHQEVDGRSGIPAAGAGRPARRSGSTRTRA
jgi:hypothetical protein